MIESQDYLWVERFRPRRVEDCILPRELKDTFNGIIAQGRIPSLLLHGGAGVGKSTIARALCDEIGADYILINASNENGVDTFRNKITQFASTVSLTGAKKAVILDECLEENESVRIGTIDDWRPVKLKDLEPDVVYPVVSFNMNTGTLENDEGSIISDKIKDIFEVTLDNRKKILVTSNHPFITKTENGFGEHSFDESNLIDQEVVIAETTIKTSRVRYVRKINRARVINLTVKKNHTFITENGIVTHNCDYSSPQLQAVLRAGMEDVSSNCTFILTCNFKNKIIEPIHSRCAVIDFKIENKDKPKLASQFFKRVTSILTGEGIEFDPKAVAELITRHFPDYRRILNELQRYSVTGKIDTGILVNLGDESFKFLVSHLKEKNFTEVRKWVGVNSDIETAELFRRLYDTAIDNLELSSIPQLVLLLADYGYKEAFSVDPEINKMACMVEIMSSCAFK